MTSGANATVISLLSCFGRQYEVCSALPVNFMYVLSSDFTPPFSASDIIYQVVGRDMALFFHSTCSCTNIVHLSLLPSPIHSVLLVAATPTTFVLCSRTFSLHTICKMKITLINKMPNFLAQRTTPPMVVLILQLEQLAPPQPPVEVPRFVMVRARLTNS